MRRNIEFNNVTAKEELSKLAEELAAKIEKRVKIWTLTGGALDAVAAVMN